MKKLVLIIFMVFALVGCSGEKTVEIDAEKLENGELTREEGWGFNFTAEEFVGSMAKLIDSDSDSTENVFKNEPIITEDYDHHLYGTCNEFRYIIEGSEDEFVANVFVYEDTADNSLIMIEYAVIVPKVSEEKLDEVLEYIEANISLLEGDNASQVMEELNITKEAYSQASVPASEGQFTYTEGKAYYISHITEDVFNFRVE